MRLALKIPTQYIAAFHSACDIIVHSQLKALERLEEESWLEADHPDKVVSSLKPTLLSYPGSISVPRLVELTQLCPKLICYWDGSALEVQKMRYLQVQPALSWEGARPHFLYRFKHLPYYYYGFKNLDELRIRSPEVLITSIPFTAALAGIDLKSRERRPKSLPEFSYEMTLSKEQQHLASLNIKAIYAAAQPTE